MRKLRKPLQRGLYDLVLTDIPGHRPALLGCAESPLPPQQTLKLGSEQWACASTAEPLTQSKFFTFSRQGWVVVRFIKLALNFTVIIKEHILLYRNVFFYQQQVIVQRQK